MTDAVGDAARAAVRLMAREHVETLAQRLAAGGIHRGRVGRRGIAGVPGGDSTRAECGQLQPVQSRRMQQHICEPWRRGTRSGASASTSRSCGAGRPRRPCQSGPPPGSSRIWWQRRCRSSS